MHTHPGRRPKQQRQCTAGSTTLSSRLTSFACDHLKFTDCQDAAYKACVLLHNTGRLEEEDVQGCHHYMQVSQLPCIWVMIFGSQSQESTRSHSADFISRLNEHMHKSKLPPPDYRFPDPDPSFPEHSCSVKVFTSSTKQKTFESRGSHPRRKQARQDAAQQALEALQASSSNDAAHDQGCQNSTCTMSTSVNKMRAHPDTMTDFCPPPINRLKHLEQAVGIQEAVAGAVLPRLIALETAFFGNSQEGVIPERLNQLEAMMGL